MGTRSTIAIQYEDGSLESIYCHWDGHLWNNGRILFEHYQDLAKIKKLIGLGDLSCLGPNIGTKHKFEIPEFNTLRWEKYFSMCTAYGRDRKEKGTQAIKFESQVEFQAMLEESWTEWVYVYNVAEKKWFFTNNASGTWFELRQNDPDDYGESRCKCGALPEPMHSCPYSADVNNNPHKQCNCCRKCQTECSRDI